MTELGKMTTAEGGEMPLQDLADNVRMGLSHRTLRSQGFNVVPVNGKCGCLQRPGAKTGKGVRLSREEVIREEVNRWIKKNPKNPNKTIRILGNVLILIERGEKYWQIGPKILHKMLVLSGFSKIEQWEVRRVMTKLDESRLASELAAGNRPGLHKAHKLYR